MTQTLKKAYNLNGLHYDDNVDRVGLWLPSNKKIGFIGIQAQKWIASHGFSINLKPECLKGFREINPCGLLNQNVIITCAENESRLSANINIHDILIDSFLETFQLNKIDYNII